MTAQGAHAAESEDTGALVSKDAPPNAIIAALVVLTGVVLVVMVVLLTQYFGIEVRAEIATKVLTQQSEALRALRVEELQRLSTYRWVDQKGGVVQLPVDRAVEVTLQEWQQEGGPPSDGLGGTAPGAADGHPQPPSKPAGAGGHSH
jgi:hypothetical protein